ncbi:branched-chain amino acid ABC transporter substrate-binding protein [Effusibacillus lacus]|uniref:Branched chain amino acid ABC transporter substrate-binding protein n=1 Tax=Effusibacillus lacus TaxID=1348429 RepID=A0A292YJZ8_9BACL|nr:branched-chain amino acid ABC transporter substrate-binding protein [Effusibacillus lacus]TCS72267.1 branched-chain amino acid transport system substrate-binding protein [Effusibacillus lacus]GAX90258.1 branched chain amino acid ABC transporter substrate-binding protein [Effusibacillus lacus]
MKVLKKIGLGLSVFSLLAVTACGSAGTSGGGSSQGGSTASEILIGVQSPTTGSEAKMGQDINNAIQLAADEINDKGGINGKKIKLVFADDACDPQTATAAANKLVSQGVVAVVGGYCSGATLPASGVYHNAGIPMVVTAANSAKIPAQGYKEIFLVNGTTVHQGEVAADHMVAKLGGKRIAIVHDNSAFAKDLAEITKKAVEKKGGQVVAFEAVNPEEKDFTSLLTKLKNAKPDATYWTAYYAAGGLLIKQFKQLGVPGVIGVGDGANDKTLIDIAGKQAAEGTFVTTSPTPEFLPEAKSFNESYTKKFSQAPGPYSALSYDGMRLLADAISRAGSTDKAAIVKALKETKAFKTFGGNVSFKEDGTLEKSNFIVIQVKDGKFSK